MKGLPLDGALRQLVGEADKVCEGCIRQLLSQGADIKNVQKVCVDRNAYIIVDTKSRIGFKLGIRWEDFDATIFAEPYYWREMPECLKNG